MKEITITIKDSEGKTYSRSWQGTANKLDAIRWTMGSSDIPYILEVSKIEEITVT